MFNYKIGRNDYCPCGSGKKYKKCCIDKDDSLLRGLVQQKVMKHLIALWSDEKVDEMTTNEIIDKLKSMGIHFDKEIFLGKTEKLYSANKLSEQWFEEFEVTAKGVDEDFPWFAAWILWKRLAPKNSLPMEQIDALIEKGYEYLSEEDDTTAACDAWLWVWRAIKYKNKPEHDKLSYLEKLYASDFFIKNVCQDLETELFNAGFEEPQYFAKRIEYCEEFCRCFPAEDELMLHNMRRGIAESYAYLKDFNAAKKELDSLVSDYPNNPWSYIAYGDICMLNDSSDETRSTARGYYEKALSLSKEKFDKAAAEERLEEFDDLH